MTSNITQADYDDALTLKKAGNDCYRNKQYDEALKNYSKVFISIGMKGSFNVDSFVNHLANATQPNSNENDSQTNNNNNTNNTSNNTARTDAETAKTKKLLYDSHILRTQVLNNMASTYIKLQKWQLCIEKCDSVLNLDAINSNGMAAPLMDNAVSKARLCKSKALRKLGRFDDALKELAGLKGRFLYNENIFVEIALCEDKDSINDDLNHDKMHKYWKEKETREENKKNRNSPRNGNSSENNSGGMDYWKKMFITYGIPLIFVLIAIIAYFMVNMRGGSGSGSSYSGEGVGMDSGNSSVVDGINATNGTNGTGEILEDSASGAEIPVDGGNE